jgi:hypothetical protein
LGFPAISLEMMLPPGIECDVQRFVPDSGGSLIDVHSPCAADDASL